MKFIKIRYYLISAMLLCLLYCSKQVHAASYLLDVASTETNGGTNSGAPAILDSDQLTINTDGSITTTGAAYGICLGSSNTVLVDNSSAAEEVTSVAAAIKVNDSSTGNTITINTTAYVQSTGAEGLVLGASATKNDITINGTLHNSVAGKAAMAMDTTAYANTVTISGTVENAYNGSSASYGAEINGDSVMVMKSGSTVSTAGVNSITLNTAATASGSAALHIGGTVTAASEDAVAVNFTSSETFATNTAIYFFDTASTTGKITSTSSNSNSACLIFGYATDVNGEADLTTADAAFAMTVGGNIESSGTDSFDGFFAAGETTLSGSKYQFKRVFVGADSFDGTIVSDGYNADTTQKTATLGALANTGAILNVNGEFVAEELVTGEDSSINFTGSGTKTITNVDLTGGTTADPATADSSLKVEGTSDMNITTLTFKGKGNTAVGNYLDNEMDRGAAKVNIGTLKVDATTDSDQVEASLLSTSGKESAFAVGDLSIAGTVADKGRLNLSSDDGGGVDTTLILDIEDLTLSGDGVLTDRAAELDFDTANGSLISADVDTVTVTAGKTGFISLDTAGAMLDIETKADINAGSSLGIESTDDSKAIIAQANIMAGGLLEFSGTSTGTGVITANEVNFTGAGGKLDNSIADDDAVAIGTLSVTGGTLGTGGTLTKSAGGNATTTVGTVNVTAAASSDGSLTLNNETGAASAHIFKITAVNLSGSSATDGSGRAEFIVDSGAGNTTDVNVGDLVIADNKNGYIEVSQTGAATTLDFEGAGDDTTIGSGATLQIKINGGTVDLNDISLAGKLDLSDTTVIPDFEKLTVTGTEAEVEVKAGLTFVNPAPTTGTIFNSGSRLTTSGAGDFNLGNIDASAGEAVLKMTGSGSVTIKGGSADNLTIQSTATGADIITSGVLAAKNLDVDANTGISSAGGSVAVGSTDTGTDTDIGNGVTLTLSGANTFALNDIAGGANSGMTVSNGTGAVTVNSVELGSGLFTFTHSDNDNVSLGKVTAGTAGNNLTIAGAGTGAVSVDTLNVSENFTLTADKAATVDNAVVAEDKILSIANTANNLTVTTMALGGTLTNYSSALQSIATLNTSGDKAKIDGTAAVAVTNRVNLDNNLEVAGAGVKTFTGGVDIKGGKTLSVYTSALHSLGDIVMTEGKLAILAAAAENTLTGTSLTLGSGSTGTIDVASGKTYSTGSTTFSNNAVLNVSGDGTVNLGAVTGNTNHFTVNIGRGSTAEFGATDLTTAAGRKINIDLGLSETAAAGTYGKLKGAANITTSGGASGIVNEVYGVNGVAGLTYSSVLDGAFAGGGVNDGDVLNTDDRFRIYTLGNSCQDITVTTNSDRISEIILGSGSSTTVSAAAENLIENQKNLNAEGQQYVDGLTSLDDSTFVRAMDETIGENTTLHVNQATVKSIQQGSAALNQQLGSFRTGFIAVAMASAYSSGGMTAALDDMADPDTLADAYGSGFTAAAEVEYGKQQVWVNGFGGFGEQASTSNQIGYDFYNAGMLIGFDYLLARELRVGAILSYSYNKATRYWNYGHSVNNSLRFGVYGSYNWNNFFVDLSPSMGFHFIDSKRNVYNGSVATGDRVGIDFDATGTIGYTFNFINDYQVTPTLALGYSRFYDPEFTETGAGAANIAYSDFTTNSLVQDFGVKGGKLWVCSDRLSFLPEAWVGWEYEYLDTGGNRNTTTSAALGSQNYATTMNGMAKNRAYWGTGVTALVNDNISVYGRYDHKIWDKGFNVGFSSGVKVKF